LEENFEDSLPIRSNLPLKERRRYAKASRAFELGLWGHSLELIKGVELTTRGDYRNNWANVVQDNRDLRKAMRKEGILSEDCFAAEISPKHHLLHLHGFYRLFEPKQSAELHKILSDKWGRLHGAPVVWVQDIYSVEGLIKYNLKHALKNYSTLEFGNMRLLKSHGWLPENWKKVQGVLVKWALEHGSQWSMEDDPYGLFEVGGREYVPFAWEVMTDYLRKWCCGEIIRLEFQDVVVMIWGGDIDEYQKR